jgi:hypothetical protein
VLGDSYLEPARNEAETPTIGIEIGGLVFSRGEHPASGPVPPPVPPIERRRWTRFVS